MLRELILNISCKLNVKSKCESILGVTLWFSVSASRLSFCKITLSQSREKMSSGTYTK